MKPRGPLRIVPTVVLLGLALSGCRTPAPERNLLEEYRRAEFGDTQNIFPVDDGYRNRMALEFDLVRSGRLAPLREGLHDSNRFVRSFSVSALGVLGDRASEGAIAKLVEDPGTDPMVGSTAVQALGWLKSGLESVRSARATSRTLSRRLLDVAEREIQDSVDHAAPILEAYRLGLRAEEVGSARVGAPAPDFSATDTEGRAFRLSDAVRQHRVVLVIFVAADW